MQTTRLDGIAEAIVTMPLNMSDREWLGMTVDKVGRRDLERVATTEPYEVERAALQRGPNAPSTTSAEWLLSCGNDTLGPLLAGQPLSTFSRDMTSALLYSK